MDLFAGGNPDEDMLDVDPWLTEPGPSSFDDAVDALFPSRTPSLPGAHSLLVGVCVPQFPYHAVSIHVCLSISR
jgi:hypothetical protein